MGPTSSNTNSTVWNAYAWNGSNQNLYFSFSNTSTFPGGSADKGFISSTGSGQMNFTGQHRTLLNNNISDSYVGLIVSSTGKFVNLDNSIVPNINESLPYCEITSINNDKRVFGVISDKEDNETKRNYLNGCWGTVATKENTNEQRMYINSVGEGAIWVCNKNGTFENGDYISSSTVSGYGLKQADASLHNYTVAKVTCDCNFNTKKL